jgi:hypothetical protein
MRLDDALGMSGTAAGIDGQTGRGNTSQRVAFKQGPSMTPVGIWSLRQRVRHDVCADANALKRR